MHLPRQMENQKLPLTWSPEICWFFYNEPFTKFVEQLFVLDVFLGVLNFNSEPFTRLGGSLPFIDSLV